MKYISVMLLVMLFQAVPPVPRKAIANPGSGTDDIHNNGKTNDAFTPTMAIENSTHPPHTQEKGSNAATEEEPRHIVVDHLPGKDHWDKVYICLTAALVIIGGFTLKAIWIQANETARAANAAEDAAKAAKTSSDALANIERAWVDIKMTRIGPAVYTIEMTNYGRTVAHIREYSLLPTLFGPSVPPPSEPIRYFTNKLLVPNVSWHAKTLNLAQDLGNDILQKVRSEEIHLAYRAIVKYGSLADIHTSECRYFYNASESYDCLVPVEAPEYNEHT